MNIGVVNKHPIREVLLLGCENYLKRW